MPQKRYSDSLTKAITRLNLSVRETKIVLDTLKAAHRYHRPFYVIAFASGFLLAVGLYFIAQ